MCDDVPAARAVTRGLRDGEGSVYILLGPAEQESLDDANQILRGETAKEYVGYRVAALGDLNGDGEQDYSVSNRYDALAKTDGVSAYLVTEYVPGVMHPRDVGVTVHYDLAFPSTSVQVSRVDDVNGDGYSDVAFAGTEYLDTSVLEVIEGPFDGGSLGLSKDADVVFHSVEADRIEGVYANAYMGGNRLGGLTLSGESDLNGDGFPDLAFASPYADTDLIDVGNAYVLFGGGSP